MANSGKQGSKWSTVVGAAVTNPMNYHTGNLADRTFASGSETICATQIFNPCSERAPLGDPRVPAWGYMGVMRTLHNPDWDWSNPNGPEYFCTDGGGKLAELSLCDSQPLNYIKQRVAATDQGFSSEVLTRTTNSPMWGKAIPTVCGGFSGCDNYLPVGAPLGN